MKQEEWKLKGKKLTQLQNTCSLTQPTFLSNQGMEEKLTQHKCLQPDPVYYVKNIYDLKNK